MDLTQTEEALWAAVNPKARTKINRAERDGMICSFGGRDFIAALAPDYEAMRRRHGLSPLNTTRLKRLADADRLVIGVARDAQARAWAWHVWLLAESRARQLHSITNAPDRADSEANAIAGRANRLLHWRSFLEFRARGLKCCDLGGVSLDPADTHGARIAAFKAEFGGRREQSWDALKPLTFKGRATLAVLGLLGRSL